MYRGTSQILALGVINIIIAIGGLFIWRFFYPYDTLLSMLAVLLAFVTYFGFIAISQSLGKGLISNIGSMRAAITSAVLVLYFFILSVATFISSSPSDKYALSEFAKIMINNFTTTIGIIIPFYFGASAYVQVHASSKCKDGQNDISDNDR